MVGTHNSPQAGTPAPTATQRADVARSLAEIRIVPNVAAAHTAAADLFVSARTMSDTIAADDASDAQARAETPTFREDHARWMRNARERMAAQNRESRAVIAEHEAEMSQFDEFGFARFDDDACAEAQAHEDEHGSGWEIEGFGEVAA